MATRIKQRRDTAQNWTTNNPILAAGETGWETDTRMVKLGDGSTAWNKLPYAVTGDLQIKNTTIASDGAVTLASGSGMQENWIAVVDGSEGVTSDRDASYSDAVAYDSQGNAFMIGYNYIYTTSTVGCWVIKLGPDGQEKWKSYFSEYESYGQGVAVDKNDDVYILMDTGSGNGNPTDSEDISLVKLYGTTGQIAWQKTFNSVGDHDDYGNNLAVDKDNNLFISGTTIVNSYPIFLLMKIAGQQFTVGQTVYQPGDIIWQRGIAANEGCSANYYSNIAVDSNGDVGLIGDTYVGTGYVPIVKVSGVDGHTIWQTSLPIISADNANYSNFGGVAGTGIAADNQGNFYIALTNKLYSGSDYYDIVVAKIPNVSTGTQVIAEWAKTIGITGYDQLGCSVTCDSENNVYLSANLFDYTGGNLSISGRYAVNVSKWTSGGTLLWQRNLVEEQTVTYPGINNGPFFPAQTIAVNDKYVLLAGNSYHVDPFGGNNSQNGWDTAFMAQVDKTGTEFEVNGWRFMDSQLPTKSVTLGFDHTNTFNPLATTATTLTSVPSYIVATQNTDVVNLTYLDKSRTKTVTYDSNTLSISPGGSLDIPREKAGWIGIVGNFDGAEGTANTGDNFYFNGVLNDDEGNTYAVGAWLSGNVYALGDQYNKPAIITKIDKDGKQLWMASSSMENYCQTVDIAIHPVTKNLVVLNTDGSEGFNIYTINPVDGVMIGEPTHVRNADKYYASGNLNSDDYTRSGAWAYTGPSNVWVQSLALMSDGTPVVAGYVTSERDEYQNVTPVLSGSSTSTNAGVLVVPHSTFNRSNLPEENGQWYIASTSTTAFYTLVAYVNRYGYGTGLTPVNVSVANSTATGALFWVQIDPASGAYSAHLNSGGSNYTVNDTLKIIGSQVGGTDSINDVLLTVSTVNTSTGAILTFATAGTSNNTIVKLDTDVGYDFTAARPFDVLEETGSDGFVWTPTWGLAIGNTTGTDYLNAVAVDGNDDVIVGGYYNDTGLRNAYHNSNSENSILTKLSSTGTVIWTQSLDGYEGYGEVRGIVTDPDNNVYALANQDGWISVTKLDPNGNMFWYKLFNLGNTGDYSGTGIAIDSDRNIVIGGSFYNNYFTDRPDGDESMYAIIKLNSEGDVVFQRKLGTHLYEWQTGYDDQMVNSLSVGGDRISVIGYGSWNYSYNGLVASLPLDGTGSGIDGTEGGQGGIYGEFQYQNVEFNAYRFYDRSTSPSASDYPVLPFTAQTRKLEFTTQYAYATGTNVTLYIDGPEGYPTPGQVGTMVIPVYEPNGGSITNVANIKFEDGSVQTTAGGNIIPQTDLRVADQKYVYIIRPQDAGHHIYRRYNWGSNNNHILLTNDVNSVLPIGTVINIVSGQADVLTIGTYISDFDGGDGSPDETSIDIYASAPSCLDSSGNPITDHSTLVGLKTSSNNGWWLAPWSTAQLLKVEKYVWVLTCTSPLGTGISF